MPDSSVKIAGIEFRNPVMPAAGPNVRDAELMRKAVEGGAGAIVTKTISIVPADDPRPTIRKTACNGIMNCETWSEIPADEFIADCKKVKNLGVPLIVSIGYKADEVARLGKIVQSELEPDGIEFSTHYVGRQVEPLVEIAKSLRQSVDVPIFMKISPNFLGIEELAVAVSPYVDGFVAINSFGPVLDFDPENIEPKLGSQYGQGWLSGAPILPIALRIVHQITSVQEKPVIGVGGISRGIDAIKFFMAGASAVQVCSAAIQKGNSIYGKIAGEIDDWLEKHGYSSLAEIKGMYRRSLRNRREFSQKPVMTIDESKCTGCKACISRCVQGALYFADDKAKVVAENCIGCGYCQDFCAFDAMKLQ